MQWSYGVLTANGAIYKNPSSHYSPGASSIVTCDAPLSWALQPCYNPKFGQGVEYLNSVGDVLEFLGPFANDFSNIERIRHLLNNDRDNRPWRMTDEFGSEYSVSSPCGLRNPLFPFFNDIDIRSLAWSIQTLELLYISMVILTINGTDHWTRSSTSLSILQSLQHRPSCFCRRQREIIWRHWKEIPRSLEIRKVVQSKCTSCCRHLGSIPMLRSQRSIQNGLETSLTPT